MCNSLTKDLVLTAAYAVVGRWREDLSADEQAEVLRLCGPRLRELGYEA